MLGNGRSQSSALVDTFLVGINFKVSTSQMAAAVPSTSPVLLHVILKKSFRGGTVSPLLQMRELGLWELPYPHIVINGHSWGLDSGLSPIHNQIGLIMFKIACTLNCWLGLQEPLFNKYLLINTFVICLPNFSLWEMLCVILQLAMSGEQRAVERLSRECSPRLWLQRPTFSTKQLKSTIPDPGLRKSEILCHMWGLSITVCFQGDSWG